MNGLRIALSFLTVLPVGPRGPWPGLGPALPYFPLVGLIIGLTLMGADLAIAGLLGPYGRAAVTVALWAALTGGLHLEGLADAADGLLASRPAQERLEIMRAPAVGAFGTAAVGLVLLLKFGLLTDLSGQTSRPALAVAPLAARHGVLAPMGLFPYARPEGLGQGLKRRAVRAFAAAALPVLAVGYLLAGPAALAATGLALGAGLGLGLFARRRLGGLTGDVYGAIIELGEVFVLAGFAAWEGLR